MIRQIGYVRKNVQGNRVYDVNGVGATLASQTGGLGGAGVSLIIDNGLSKNKRNEDETLTNTQTSTFESISEEETAEKKTFKYISLFAGIGGFDFGLNAVGGECVFASEIDKFAKQAYTTLHGLEPHGDITQIDAKDIPDHDVIAAGFPCQSFSVAGKRGGFEDARGTLFFEVARIASEKQPKVLLLENVKGLVGHDKGKTLDTIVKTLNEIGYRVDFEVLNSKYFGVPQNRERIFIVAIREDLVANEPWSIAGNTVVPKGKRRISGYEDVKTFNFDWPTNDTVQLRLKDVLETSVDEKYYLDEEKTAQLTLQLDERLGIQIKETEPNKIAGIYGTSQAGSVWDKNGMSPTLKTNSGGYSEPIITEDSPDGSIKIVGNPSNTGHGNMNVHDPTGISPTVTARDYKGAKLVAEGLPIPKASEESGVNQETVIGVGHHPFSKKREFSGFKDVSPTLIATDYKAPKTALTDSLRIRKLTPLECWRLQGFTDEQHNAVESSGISNSQRYKMAGNAVTVNVIEAIGTRLLPYL